MSSISFKNVIKKMCLQITYTLYIYIYICKQDLALNNLQWLIYHKTEPSFKSKITFKRIPHKSYMYILFNCVQTNHYHHVAPSARIFLTLSLTTPPYRPLFLAGFPGYIQYQHRAAACMFELDDLPLLVPVKGSTGVHHL